MQLQIKHQTRYAYSQPVDYALQQVRLRPGENPLQSVQEWSLDIEGGQIETSYLDHYGNKTDLVSAMPGATEIVITASGTVDTVDAAGVLGPGGRGVPLWHFLNSTEATTPGPNLQILARSLQGAEETLPALHALSTSILSALPYQIGETYSGTTAEEALGGSGGVCQDHAQIFIATARLANLPARYVSGYLMMNDRVDQEASHAWAEVHVEGLGWVGFDVSNGICPDDRYVRIAVGRDAREAAPVRGLRRGDGQEEMLVSLQVQQ